MHGERPTERVGHAAQELEIFGERLVVLVGAVGLARDDDGGGADEAREVVDVTVRVVAGDAAVEPQRLRHAELLREHALEIALGHARVADLHGLGEEALTRREHRALSVEIDAAALEHDAPLADILAVIRRHKYSRYPVWDSHKGEFIGLLHIKDLLRLVMSGEPLARRHVRPMPYIPMTMPLDEVVSTMRQHRAHMVVVMDEHGGTAGSLTVESSSAQYIAAARSRLPAAMPATMSAFSTPPGDRPRNTSAPWITSRSERASVFCASRPTRTGRNNVPVAGRRRACPNSTSLSILRWPARYAAVSRRNRSPPYPQSQRQASERFSSLRLRYRRLRPSARPACPPA